VNLWHSHPCSGRGRFIFTLYPGGGFELGSPLSDQKLSTILSDSRTAKVITTQRATYDYLTRRGFCDPDRIVHLFGGLIPSCLSPAESSPPERGAGPLNVCFVAQRYTERGIEKGCDVFVDVVRSLQRYGDICFHFVGGWTPENVGLAAADNIKFYGIRPAEFFTEFYRSMDIIVSPNISHFELDGERGSFDGFPTTTCVEAAVEGVALLLTDTLAQNRRLDGTPIFEEGIEFEKINRDAEEIATLLLHYRDNRHALKALAERGRAAMLREFSFEKQIKPRLDLLELELNRRS